ncbi:CFI-box-CTERM domain-containing protein [Roseobacter sp. S98]|uniref:CFI-box-CTERM domain-containing protein n=1 Tax=Roseobacter algicola (ex Choi et al. 2025) (nom. illeg.) TaxID=3092138 RepID=UPI003F515057
MKTQSPAPVSAAARQPRRSGSQATHENAESGIQSEILSGLQDQASSSPPAQRLAQLQSRADHSTAVLARKPGGEGAASLSADMESQERGAENLQVSDRSTDLPPPVQRVPLGIRTAPGDAGVELDSASLDPIRTYVADNEAANRQDLNRLLVEAVRRKDHDSLPQIQAIVNAHQNDGSKKAVPNVIHMIWIGDSIGSGEVENIRSIHASITDKVGWGIKLWTDSRKCGFLDGSDELRQLALAPNFEINRTLQDQVDDRVKPTYEIAYEKTQEGAKGAFTMMSDLARYSILLSEGGIYMDVDLNLGDADVSSWDMTMSDETGIPAFGPNIQYVGDMESNLPMALARSHRAGDLTVQADLQNDLAGGVRQAFQKMFETGLEVADHTDMSADTLAGANAGDSIESDQALSDKTRIAAMAQYMRGNISNNLVAAPPNQRFLDFMLEKIGNGLQKADYDYDPAMVPFITGPVALMPLILEFYGQQNEREAGANPDSETKRALMDPNWVSQLIQVEWLTGVHKAREERNRQEEAARAAAPAAPRRRRGPCYLTTACVTHRGLSDDCTELEVLRRFRDEYLLTRSDGEYLVGLYYRTAPAIVAAIHRREDEEEIWETVYGVISLCVAAIRVGQNEKAFHIYCTMVKKLEACFLETDDLPDLAGAA